MKTMSDAGNPEVQTPEVRYGEIAKSFTEWAKANRIDYSRSIEAGQNPDGGEWQTPEGEKFQVLGAVNRIVVTTGNKDEMKKYVVSFSDERDGQTLKYLEGPSNLMGTGIEPKIGFYGRDMSFSFTRYDQHTNVDVFQPMEEVIKKLQTAQKVS